VAYVEERPTGWLVVWRDSETNRKRSRLVAWGGAADLAGGVVTKDDARQRAEQLAAEMRKRERAYGEPLKRVARQAAQDGYEPIFSPSANDFVGDGEGCVNARRGRRQQPHGRR
jgi:hypothetical protein